MTRIGGQPVLLPPGARHLVADVDGFNVHAHTHVGTGKRDELERLCRYILRPADDAACQASSLRNDPVDYPGPIFSVSATK